MVRKLFATTALATLLATGAFAQGTMTSEPSATPMPADSASDPAAMPGESAADETMETASAAGFDYLTGLQAGQQLSDELVGASVYSSAATGEAGDEEIAEIRNLVLGADGTVAAVVVELDQGSREIAVPFDRFEWMHDEDGDARVVLTASADELAAAPDFEDDDAAGTADTAAVAQPGADVSEPAGMAAAPAGTTDPDMAAAPASDASGELAVSEPMGGEGQYLARLETEQFLADDLVGDSVYTGPTTDADNIGTINNLVINDDGTVAAVVVGVGGFLGIGEKNVGVPFQAVELTHNEEGEQHAALAVSREQLEAAPDFDDTTPAEMAATDAEPMAPAGTDTAGMAAGTGAAVGGAGIAQENQMAAGSEAMPGMAGDTAGAPETTSSVSGTQQPGGLEPVQEGELTADNLIGTTVYGPNEETIGSIGDIALSPEGGVDAIIIDVGGFLGIGAKPVAVSMDNLAFMRDSSGSMFLTTSFTQDQLEAAPEFDEASFAENRDQMLIESEPVAQQ